MPKCVTIPRLQPSAAGIRRPERQAATRAQIGMSVLLWWCLGIGSLGCGEDEGPEPVKDAGSAGDAATEGGTGQRDDAGDMSGLDSGPVEVDMRCGGDDRLTARLLRGGTTIFPGGPTDERSLRAIVTSVEVSSTPSGLSRIRLAAGADDYTIETSGMTSPNVDIGAELELSFQQRWSPPYPEFSRVELRVGNAIVFFYAKNHHPLPDGFSRSWGAERCRWRARCEEYTVSALRLTGPCGATVELGPHEQGSVCDWDVAVGSLLEKIERMDNTCGSEGHVSFELLMARQGSDQQDAGL